MGNASISKTSKCNRWGIFLLHVACCNILHLGLSISIERTLPHTKIEREYIILVLFRGLNPRLAYEAAT